MVSFEPDVRVELGSGFFRNLSSGIVNVAQSLCECDTNQSLRLFDVFMTEEELAIEVAEIDGVKIDDVDLTEASEDKILQKLTADAAGTDH